MLYILLGTQYILAVGITVIQQTFGAASHDKANTFQLWVKNLKFHVC